MYYHYLCENETDHIFRHNVHGWYNVNRCLVFQGLLIYCVVTQNRWLQVKKTSLQKMTSLRVKHDLAGLNEDFFWFLVVYVMFPIFTVLKRRKTFNYLLFSLHKVNRAFKTKLCHLVVCKEKKDFYSFFGCAFLVLLLQKRLPFLHVHIPP